MYDASAYAKLATPNANESGKSVTSHCASREVFVRCRMIKIVRATEHDINTIFHFICELAKFEKLEHEVQATPELLRQHLFSGSSPAEVVFIEAEEVKVGFALYFTSFSTFLGKPGLYLEDLFVLPEHRGRGYGKKLLAHLARTVVDRNYGRLEWSVLNWNQAAIDLYLSLGAKPMNEWTVHRLTGAPLTKLSASLDL